MVSLLIILFLALFDAPEPGQENRPAGPVEVVNLEVYMHPVPDRPSSPGPKPAPTPPGLIIIDDLAGGNQKERKDPMTIRNRSIELRTPSGKLGSPGQPSLMSRYEYRLRVRNTGAKKIKSILWEYQLRDPTNTSTISSRLFLCAVAVKPKGLSFLQARAPADPINAASAEASAAEPRKQRALVNRVEYTDGSTWQRERWQPTDSNRPEAIRKLRVGQCTHW